MEQYNAILAEKLKSLGVSGFGFADIAAIDPVRAKTLPRAVSILVKLSDYVVDEIDSAPTFAYFQHYRTVNAYIDQVLLQVGLLIESLGYRYLPVAASQSIPAKDTPYSALISHKAVARAAGLGTIGKSALFLSYQYGPRVRLGTILTDLPLAVVSKPMHVDVCRACSRCVQSCPAMALKGTVYESGVARAEIIDAAACSSYMKQKFQHIGRGAVCGICMRVCPYRGEAGITEEERRL